MYDKQKTMDEILEELKKMNEESDRPELWTDGFWVLLLFFVACGWNTPDRTKESYLQGKVDAYEKVIRRLF